MAQRDSDTIFGALGRHPVHAFPARMAPEIAGSLIRRSHRRLRILDPMMGSGTVIALAQSRRHQAIGVDIDPLATLIARVWTCPIVPEIVRRKAREVLRRAQHRSKSIPARDAYPPFADDETRRFVRYWFDISARRELTALSLSISRIKDHAAREVFWCALSRLIIARRGASKALDLVHSRPHLFFSKAPVAPFSKFLDAVEWILSGVPIKHKRNVGPRAKIRLGDARKLRWVRSSSIDLVLTSPPYLNAIDYMRCSKFSLVWMGYAVGELAKIRAKSVGAEVGRTFANDAHLSYIVKRLQISTLPRRQRHIISSYIMDMRAAIEEVARILAPGGRAVYVIGENTIRGVYVKNSKILALLAAEAGLKVETLSRRSLPPNRRYLPPPSSGADALDSRMRSEIIIHLRKRRSL